MNALHIGVFGRRNYGKSTLVNFCVGQDVSIVSPTPGTTTDPVRKSMELVGVGPVVLVDTAGVDDEGSLGSLRAEKAIQLLSQVDMAIIVFTANLFDSLEVNLVESCRSGKIPFLLVYSQADKYKPSMVFLQSLENTYSQRPFVFSYLDTSLQPFLLQRIKEILLSSSSISQCGSLLADVVKSGDTAILVVPIDSAAPKDRLILPQVQVLRDLLDNHVRAIVCRDSELQSTLDILPSPPQLVVTDSQVFPFVADVVPQSVPLTSFSVILARSKGPFEYYLQGVKAIDTLNDNDAVLIFESCTHNVTCEDIGRVKIPALLAKHTGRNISFSFVSGLSSLPRPITDYKLVIQCGGCVATSRQIHSRLSLAINAGIPVTNYGLVLAYLSGIFPRATAMFQRQ